MQMFNDYKRGVLLGILVMIFVSLPICAVPREQSKGNSQPLWLSSTGGKYPVIKPQEHIWLSVSLHRQRVFIMKDNAILYTMIASTGLDIPADDATPKGVFYIQRERGKWFYAANVHEGARYWVSWKNHGEYLFHSVPMDKEGRIIHSEAIKLGHKASHGCIRLSLPDAKWMFDHIPFGTKVVISE